MAQLDNKLRGFIVKQLAMFEHPSAVCNLVKEKFDVEISRQQVAYYNPGNNQGGRELARKWRHLFDETRDTFIRDSAQIPIAHKNYRLKELQKMYKRLFDAGDFLEACKVLKQAAKEMGSAYGVPITVDNSTKDFYQKVNQKIIQFSNNEW